MRDLGVGTSGSWIRGGLVLLAAAGAVVGFWALLAPRSFYDDFPGGGSAWVSALPPYNEHLIRDVGGLNLALALLLTSAAVIMERRLVQVACAAALTYAAPHLVFHVANLESLSTADQVAETLTLALAAALPLGLLALASRRPLA